MLCACVFLQGRLVANEHATGSETNAVEQAQRYYRLEAANP